MPPVPSLASGSASLHHLGDAQAIDLFHREDVHVRGAHQLLLDIVEITDADQHGVFRGDRRLLAADAGELGGFRPEQRAERHAVDVAGIAGVGTIHVAVRVHPDQSERLAARALIRRGRRHRARAEAVIAAQHDRQRALMRARPATFETASGTPARCPSHSASAHRPAP